MDYNFLQRLDHSGPRGRTSASASRGELAVILNEFLVAEELQGLLDYTLRNARRFTRSTVIRADGISELDLGHRRSRVLFDIGPYESVIEHRLITFLPYVLWRLQYPIFPVSKVEIQLTGTNHAEFFGMHSDNDADEVTGRQITFVYFFHREPRRFGGGELRIFEPKIQDSHSVAARPYWLIYPLQNQVVFFPSSYLHEILPVVCPSGNFANSRFTVNGWFHR